MVLAGDILLWVDFVLAFLFVFGYALTAPFWRTEEGTHVLTFTLFLAFVFGYLTYAVSNRVEAPQSPLIRLMIFTGMALFLGWRLALLIRRQVLDRRHEELIRTKEGNS